MTCPLDSRVVRDALGRLRGLGGDDSAEVVNQAEPVLQSEQELSEQPAAAAADEPIASGEEGGRTAIPVGAAMTAFSIDDAPRDFLFFVPHQDDEMLTFGIGIIQAVRAGHRVHVILCTDGGLDGTRVRLASGGECELNTLEGGKYRLHDDPHRYTFDVEEFSALRDAEFRASCERMGVLPCRIHIFPDRAKDGYLTSEQAVRTIESYLALFPDAVVVTEVPNDYPVYDPIADIEGRLAPGPHWYHLDHQTLGRGALKLFEEGRIGEVHFFADPYHKPHIDEVSSEEVYETIRPSEDEKAQLLQVLEVYRTWKPENNQFAIGWHSAHEIFPTVTEDFNNYRYSLKRDAQK